MKISFITIIVIIIISGSSSKVSPRKHKLASLSNGVARDWRGAGSETISDFEGAVLFLEAPSER